MKYAHRNRTCRVARATRLVRWAGGWRRDARTASDTPHGVMPANLRGPAVHPGDRADGREYSPTATNVKAHCNKSSARTGPAPGTTLQYLHHADHAFRRRCADRSSWPAIGGQGGRVWRTTQRSRGRCWLGVCLDSFQSQWDAVRSRSRRCCIAPCKALRQGAACNGCESDRPTADLHSPFPTTSPGAPETVLPSSRPSAPRSSESTVQFSQCGRVEIVHAPVPLVVGQA